jgi:molecular chaperone DnaJ
MLNNPEKYKKEEQRKSYTYQNPYGSPYGNSGQGGSEHRGYDYQGGFGSFGDFDFEDIFGFSGTYETAKPEAQPTDSMEIRQAVDFINRKQYQAANSLLNSIAGRDRNARWYYLSALANQGLGNTLSAAEQIDKAVQLDSGNSEYRKVRQYIHGTGNRYNEAGREFQRYAEGMQRFCMGLCAAQFCCTFCCH